MKKWAPIVHPNILRESRFMLGCTPFPMHRSSSQGVLFTPFNSRTLDVERFSLLRSLKSLMIRVKCLPFGGKAAHMTRHLPSVPARMNGNPTRSKGPWRSRPAKTGLVDDPTLRASASSCKLFHSMRYFFDNYVTHITICLPKVKGFKSACEALSVVAETETQCCHYVT